jgi:DNA modification methylase
MREVGLQFYGDICWLKQNAVGKTRPAWGTFCSCRNLRIRRNHEYLLIFSKGSSTLDGNPELCDLTPDEFEQWTLSTWHIQPERRRIADHPAAFPEKLAERVIRLFSYVGDIVLDPFCGTGTVPYVARRFHRRYIGIDNAPGYVDAARARIASLNRHDADMGIGARMDGAAVLTSGPDHMTLET